ncbi:replication protein, partial [Stenotrophomonas maltophilia group sp. RNC7]|uniref:replication protein n=1 Tax=Stenotrophomonas maltophilia group sp. RNC7 TaxID=3071467 RepID=UPI0027E0ADA2
MVKYKFNGTQLKIVMIIWRYTYGFQRKEHSLSLNFITEAINSSKNVVKKELDTLIKNKVVSVTEEASFNSSRKIGFNKNYDEWGIPIGVQSINENTEVQLVDSQSTNRSTPQSTNRSAKKESIKENIKEKDYESVFNFYLTLNLKKHRAYTNDMKRAINKAVKDNKYSTEYCKTLLERHKQVVDITKQHEFPVRVRGFAEFFGQKVYGATHLICSEYEEGGKYYEQYLKEHPKTKVDIRTGVPPSESVLGEREEE